MEEKKYRTSEHCKYICQYHIIWCTKFRYSIMKGKIEEAIKEILLTIAQKYKYKILALEVMPDHLHIFISCHPTIAPIEIVRTLKSITTIEIFKRFPTLKSFYKRCGSLWSKGKFISTVGHLSSEIVKKYIEEQQENGTKTKLQNTSTTNQKAQKR